MNIEILINVRPNQTRVAYVQDGELADLKVERKASPTLVGSVFKGKVIRVLPGMQAAFVDIGLDRAAFLYVGDVRTNIDDETGIVVDEVEEVEAEIIDVAEETEGVERKPDDPKIQDLLEKGQSIMVQVAKDPLGTKGARITTHITLPGRTLVLMPTVQHVGISRRIESEDERNRLQTLFEKLSPGHGGIMRTAAEGSTETQVQADLDFLNRIWKEIQKSYDRRKKPGLVYSDLDVELRALRDLLTEDVEKVIVDDIEVHKKVSGFVSQFMPKFKKKVELYESPQPLFDIYDIDLEISRSLGRKIWLKSGGYIVIDEAEAFVAIDVNTGKYVGKKDLEDTILKTNLEAAKEIAHQLRIRNCGGIIIIDFIDMEKEAHQEKVVGALEEELAKDRARTAVTSMSPLGLVEMTRKRIRPSLVSTLCDPCPYCEGKGYIRSKMTVANEIFRALEREPSPRPKVKSVVVKCHQDVADWIYEVDHENLEHVETSMGQNIIFKVEPGFHREQYEIEFI
ncbi:MAG: Rne/Rng family ribonuclease [Bdellovibrionaceae bacterium]|nr:Rne/Rng family ribonuclease [Pseudobdellovibrionaceae bacterium]